jgi:hypothetical protein
MRTLVGVRAQRTRIGLYGMDRGTDGAFHCRHRVVIIVVAVVIIVCFEAVWMVVKWISMLVILVILTIVVDVAVAAGRHYGSIVE